MWKYIVTWCVLSYVIIPPEDQKDKFGRSANIEYPVLIYQLIENCNNERVFYNKDSAYNFYNEALSLVETDTFHCLNPDSTRSGRYIIFETDRNLRNIKIDSIFIKY